MRSEGEAPVTTSVLAEGSHTLTLHVTDSPGNVTEQTACVLVGHRVYLPGMLR